MIHINNHQRNRFAKKILKIYNTVSGKIVFMVGLLKKILMTLESAAIYVADLLLDEKAKIEVYDPKVSSAQIHKDINELETRLPEDNINLLKVKKTHMKQLMGHMQ